MKTGRVDTELQAAFVGSIERKLAIQKSILVFCRQRDEFKKLLKPGFKNLELSTMIERIEVAISILKGLVG